MSRDTRQRYRATESKYKGRAKELYVIYDLAQETRGGGRAPYPKVKRVYIAGKVKDWKVGNFAKRTGRRVRGVKIDYEQSRARYSRAGYTASRGSTEYRVAPTSVAAGTSRFTQIVEVPKDARHVRFAGSSLPRRYKSALQSIR